MASQANVPDFADTWVEIENVDGDAAALDFVVRSDHQAYARLRLHLAPRGALLARVTAAAAAEPVGLLAELDLRGDVRRHLGELMPTAYLFAAASGLSALLIMVPTGVTAAFETFGAERMGNPSIAPGGGLLQGMLLLIGDADHFRRCGSPLLDCEHPPVDRRHLERLRELLLGGGDAGLPATHH